MSQKEVDRISQLVDELRRHDHLDWRELEKEPRAPARAMRELARIGSRAIGALTSLALENLYRLSSFYAIEVLGRISDSEATTSLLAVFDALDFSDFDKLFLYEAVVDAIKRQGHPALRPTLEHIAAIRQSGDWKRWNYGLGLIENHHDSRVVDELLTGLECPIREIREEVPEGLGEQGDVRAVPHLVDLLKEEGMQEAAKDALKQLLGPDEYVRIFEKMDLIGTKRYSAFSEQLARLARDAKWICVGSEWEGDDGELLTATIQRHKKLELFRGLLIVLRDLADDEGLKAEAKQLDKALGGVLKSQEYLRSRHQDLAFPVSLSLPRYDQINLVRESICLAYQGLARQSYGPKPHLDTLFNELKEWLRGEGFRVSWEAETRGFHRLWAARGSGKAVQTCLVDLTKAESRKAIGEVRLSMAGAAWDEAGAAAFETAFRNYTTKLVQTILGRVVKPEEVESKQHRS